jgi:SAM-dependent methyltransferase
MARDRANGTPRYIAGDDTSFDRLYPTAIRRASPRYWTPVGIARRAARLLRDAGARRVLDVGSGVGKFVLVAAATAPEVSWVGIEQRAHLVVHARRAARELATTNARFVVGDATDVSWGAYDGFYFFNSFAENLFGVHERLDDRAELSFARFARDVERAHAALRAAPPGTAIATFHGSSGRIPCSFELAHVGPAASGWLRLWIKTGAADDGSFFIEVGGDVERHDADGRQSAGNGT